MQHWYAVQTKPRQETVAEENLRRQAFHTYFPRIKRPKHRRGTWQQSVEPLFPGYLFLQVDVEREDVAPIRSTRGVVGLVRYGNRLSPVPDQVIEDLVHSQPGDDAPIEMTKMFRRGDPVTLIEGPMAGLVAIFKAHTGQERVILLLEMLGRTNPIVVSHNQILPAESRL